MHPYDDDRADDLTADVVAHARQMRDEAISQWVRAAWKHISSAVARVLHSDHAPIGTPRTH